MDLSKPEVIEQITRAVEEKIASDGSREVFDWVVVVCTQCLQKKFINE